MTDKGFVCHVHRERRDITEMDNLRDELNCIRANIKGIEELNVSDEAKKPILEELEMQANEIKERMHNAIDAL